MAGAAQADRAERDAGGSHSGDPAISAGIGQWGAIQTAAPSFGVEVSPNNVRDAGEIQRAVAVFALSSNRGLILATSPAAYVHHDLIVTLAARHKFPSIYFARFFVASGGLMSYGPELVINLKTAKALGAPRATDADRTHRRDDRVAVRRMSPMGPTEKNSVRANAFRCSADSGHPRRITVRLL
jgi:hypothetical protein